MIDSSFNNIDLASVFPTSAINRAGPSSQGFLKGLPPFAPLSLRGLRHSTAKCPYVWQLKHLTLLLSLIPRTPSLVRFSPPLRVPSLLVLFNHSSRVRSSCPSLLSCFLHSSSVNNSCPWLVPVTPFNLSTRALSEPVTSLTDIASTCRTVRLRRLLAETWRGRLWAIFSRHIPLPLSLPGL